MDETDVIDPELGALHGALRDGARPDAAALSRLRERLASRLSAGAPPSAEGWRLPVWWRYPAAGAAVLALVLLGGMLAVTLVNGRGAGAGFSATVMPPAPAAQAPSADAASGAAPADRAVAGSSQAPASTSLPVVGTSCSASPTVQFQGRGLAATGTSAVTGSEQTGTVSVSVQQGGADLGAAVSAVQAKVAAVQDALTKAGVPSAGVQVSSFRTYGDAQGRQFTASASLQATVTGVDALAQATKAVFQVPGVSAYSSSVPTAGQPSQQAVRDAVGRAAAQARDMAGSTAAAAGVRLGDVQGIVAQPPVTCYGPNGPERVVQVTATYAIR